MVKLGSYRIPGEIAHSIWCDTSPRDLSPTRLCCLILDCEDPDYRQAACWRFRRPLYPGGTASC